MKVAYVVNTYPRPSHSFIRREIRALEAIGVEVTRFAMRGNRAELVDPEDIEEFERTEHVLALGVGRLARAAIRQLFTSPVRFLKGLRLALALQRSPRSGLVRHVIYLAEASYLAQRCGETGIAHVHAHFGTNSAAVAMLVHALGGPGYSFTVHGPEEFDDPVGLDLRLKMRHAAFTVAISSFGRSQLFRWADQADWARIRVVHCGIVPERFAAPLPMPAGARALVAIGRFAEQKGHLILIEAFGAALQRRPELQLVLVGDGPMRPEIEAAIARYGVGANVTITGWVDEIRVRAEIEAARALVLPSFAEGLPMVVMEAMGVGRPVIATSIAGTPELVVPGETGWLVPAGDAGVLAGAMIALAATGDEACADMGRRGWERVLERHDINRIAHQLKDLFTEASGS